MCGISAIINTNTGAGLSSYIVPMTNIIRHRGPDDEGYVVFDKKDFSARSFIGNDCRGVDNDVCSQRINRDSVSHNIIDDSAIALGHRRLSILDLSTCGRQPMSAHEQRYWITYNGEIYNYIELRAELELCGYVFLTKTDTEVILYAYSQWGSKCLAKFNGMFSFVLIDTKAKVIFSARDRFGIKPFYYWFLENGDLIIASEIKQFTVFPEWKARLNKSRAYDYLNWGLTDHTKETLFDGVFQLRGGEFFECNIENINKSLPVKKWYNLQSSGIDDYPHNLVAGFKDLFTDSVRLRLRADVDVGSCLSGGLDSSSIVVVANKLLREQDAVLKQKTISARSDITAYDEGEFIREVENTVGATGVHTYPEIENLFNELDTLIWHQDEPFGSSSIYAQWCVFKQAAAENVKVMLDGQGADEQLAGYHGYFSPFYTTLFKNGHWLRLFKEIRYASRRHGYGFAQATKLVANNLLPERIRQRMKKLIGKESIHTDWIDAELLGVDKVDPGKIYGATAGDIKKLSIAQIKHLSVPMLLHWEDRNAMAHSIESRFPFLDYRLVEYVINLPDKYKINHGTTKIILRKALSGTLPARIRDRKDKMGFVTPEEVWVKEMAPDKIIAEIRTAVKRSNGIIKKNIINITENIIRGDESYSLSIWRVINFSRWMNLYNVDENL